MENRKTKIMSTVFITAFFYILIMSNYALISYYSTNFSHSEIGTVNDVQNYKVKRAIKSVLYIQLNNKKIVSSKINNSSINQFQPGMQIKVEIYKNLFGDFFYVESINGKIEHFGPTVAFIFDTIFLIFIFLVTSSNLSHRKKIGVNNIKKIDKEFMIVLFISIIVAITFSIITLSSIS